MTYYKVKLAIAAFAILPSLLAMNPASALPPPSEISTSYNSGGGTIQFTAKNIASLSNKHWQIHIDSDNNPDTGFQFKSNNWSGASGSDYMIQDGALFKSTANDSSWSWKWLSESPILLSDKYPTDGRLSVLLDAYDKGICNTFNTGLLILSQNWKPETFLPSGNKLLQQTNSFCETNRPPVIKRATFQQTLSVGDTFVDLGATATDAEDGDLTQSITVQHRNVADPSGLINGTAIDTSVPATYLFIYSVTDSGGKTATISKNVIVKPIKSFTIDGKTDDWNEYSSNHDIARVSQYHNGELSITDEEDYLYIVVKSARVIGATVPKHWQILIDADNDPSTGFRANNGGVDYLIQNGYFNKFLGGSNQSQWYWDYGSADIELGRAQEDIYQSRFETVRHEVYEIAIPKSELANLGNAVSVSFSARDSNWKELRSLPATNVMKSHTLNYP